MFFSTKKHSYNLSLTESEKFHYSPADHVELTLKQDDACECKPELFPSQEQPRSLRTPPPADWKALKQKSLCFRASTFSLMFTFLKDSRDQQIQTCGELDQFLGDLKNMYIFFK